MITVKISRNEATFKDTQTGEEMTLTTERIKSVLSVNYRGCSCITHPAPECVDNEFEITLSRTVLAAVLQELEK